MFRFDSFKKAPESSTSTNKATQQDPLTTNTSGSLLQRIAASSPDSNANLNSFFSIPMPTNSWGMMALSRLQDINDTEIDDIVNLLLSRDKAILLLPVSIPSQASAVIDRDFIMDHVIVYNQGTSQVITLSGIRGVFQRDQLVALGLLPSEKEIEALMTDVLDKKPLFDTFNLDPSSIITDNQPKYNILASHIQIPLRDNKSITVMLIQKPLAKKDIVEWMGLSKTQDKKLPDTPSTLIDEENVKVNEFIKNYKKNPPKTPEISSHKLLDFLDDLRDEMIAKEDNKASIKKRLDVIETYICDQLYNQLFTHPDGDEAMQDEALESRIAALNLLDLDLKHLGVSLMSTSDTVLINVIKEAGQQLQQLNEIKGAKEKLETLIKTHEIIVKAIESLARQQPQTQKEVVAAEEKDNTAEVVEAVQQEMKQAIMSTTPDEAETSSVNADVLLPILIFTIVKANPTQFLSNLKFIQRYRRSEELTGQASYCFTNMMAAVSFLETTNLVGLGLSADKVFSHVTDLNAEHKVVEPSINKPISIKTNQPQTNNPGLKMVSDVFDGLGKFWQRNTQDLENNRTVSGLMDRVRKVSDAAQPIIKEGLSELKEITISNKPATARTSSSSSLSTLPSFMEDRNHRNVSSKQQKSSFNPTDGPIVKFLEMKSVDELKIGEVTELLADYKRLAAIIKQAGLA